MLHAPEANLKRSVDDNLVQLSRLEISNKIQTYIRLLKLDPTARIEIRGDRGGYVLYEGGDIVTILY